MIDLKEGVVYGKLVNGKWQQVQIPLVEGEIGTNSTPLVAGDLVIVQAAMAEGLGVSAQGVAEGTGMLGRKGVEAFGQAGKGFGGPIGGLFGGPQKK